MKEKLSTALLKRADQVARNTEILMAETRDWQMIRDYLCNKLSDDGLTAEQRKKLERYQFIYNQMVSGKFTEVEIVSQVEKNYSIKRAQAYRDIGSTREIFNTVLNINKQFEIKMQLEINRSMMRKAMEMGDMRSSAALEKNRAALLKLLPDAEENPAELFEGHELEAVFDPRLLGAPDIDMKEVLQLINDKRKVKIDLNKIVTDIEHEDLPDEEETAF